MAVLGPNVSHPFIFWLVAAYVEKLNEISNKEVEKGSFKLLDILHHFSSGFKAICTDLSYKGMD
jgi:hypothetical protein